ncbi:MAG: alpha/beta hydrolase [Salinivirgaceae bacterium]|jgi:proline iminopeptidase|nr:alpha/beta hydrolase [Salinivirgaceae bacterium]
MKKALKIIKRIGFWFLMVFATLVLVVLIWFRAVSPGKTEPITDVNGEIVKGSVAEVKYVEINGLEQFLIIRGKSVDNPVLLMLHGGPGSPQAHMNLPINKILEDYYIVVNWDQRGAGASYSSDIPAESMTIKQFVDDTYEVTKYLKERFGKNKIFLLGHSWGSYLGMRTIYKYPDEYHAYIGIGQVSDQRKSEDMSYEFVYSNAKQENNTKAIEALEAIGSPVNGEFNDPATAMQIKGRWITEYGGAVYGKSAKYLLDIFIKPLFTFREYKMSAKLNYMKGLTFTQMLLWNQLLDEQLVDMVKEVKVPIYILHGVHDYQTVYSESKSYIDLIKAPKKEFITFENSAHWLPYNDEKDKFHDVLIKQVLEDFN